MTRWLVVFVVVFAGCVMTLPADNDFTITADIAAETAREMLRLRQMMPPTPAPSDVCQRCDGRGVLGDNAGISITCPDCKGTGKKTTKPPPATCPGGTCPIR